MIKISTMRREAANVRLVSFETLEEKRAINSSNVTTQGLAGSNSAVKVWGDIEKFTNEMKGRFGAENVTVY